MENISGILIYNDFIELPESNQTFGKNQGLVLLLGAHQAEEQEHAI